MRLVPRVSSVSESVEDVAPASPRLVRTMVGGWIVPYFRAVFLTRGGLSIPLGRLDVYEDRLVFGGRGPLRRVMPEQVVPLSTIKKVERIRGVHFRPGIRIYHSGGIVSWGSWAREPDGWLLTFLERVRTARADN